MKFLNGYKSYIGMAMLAIIGVAKTAGWIDDQTAGIAASLAAGWTGVAIVHKAAKIEKKLG